MSMDPRIYWPAYAALVGFMFAWGLTPLGERGEELARAAGVEGWGWPIGGLSFFWLVYGVLWLRKRRRAPQTVAERAPGSPRDRS